MAPGHLIGRCPFCGREHDARPGGACEACGTPLRAWCRRHGSETGWVDGPACPRCAEESEARDNANAIRAGAGGQPGADGAEPRGWRHSRWRLHYLLKLTLFLTGFGAVFGTLFGLGMGGGLGGDLWVFTEGGIIGGLFASVLGALTWLVERLSGKRK